MELQSEARASILSLQQAPFSLKPNNSNSLCKTCLAESKMKGYIGGPRDRMDRQTCFSSNTSHPTIAYRHLERGILIVNDCLLGLARADGIVTSGHVVG